MEKREATRLVAARNDLTLHDLYRMFRRRRSTLWFLLTMFLAIGVLICALTTKRYEAIGSVQLQRENTDGLSRDSLTGSTPLSVDALGESMTIQTQSRILQSNALALRTIYGLRIENTVEFSSSPNLSGRLISVITKGRGGNTLTDDSTVLRKQAKALQTFRKNLSIEPLSGSRVIQISYVNRDPQIAASVVNRLIQELTDYNFETGYKATEAASQALTKQLGDLRQQSQDLQAKVAEMQRQSGIYSIGTTDAQGRQQSYSSVLEQFERASATLSDATQTRILKEAIYHAAKSGDAETLSSLAGNSILGAAPSSITNSLGTIQNLRSQQGMLQGQLDQLKAKFDSGYPKLAEIRANIDSLNESISQEVERVAKRAENDYLIADRTWQNALRTYNYQKIQADALNDKAIQYMIARQEADDSRALYEDLFKRLKEAGILQGLKSNFISVVDPALVPIKPKSPNIPLYLGFALLTGLLAGSVAVVCIDSTDDKIWDCESIEQLGFPVVGVIPEYEEQIKRGNLKDVVQSKYGEAVCQLRFEVARISDRQSQIVLVTSSSSDPNTIGLVMDLAASIAQRHCRTLLVDADLRGNELAKAIGLPTCEGLSQLLSGSSSTRVIINHPRVSYLSVIPSGQMQSDASELVESERMRDLLAKWKDEYDFIVINSPSTSRFTEALYLAGVSDIVLQIVKYRETTKRLLTRSHTLLKAHCTGQIGTVLVGVPQRANQSLV
jgi:succinoglycan biosynthesis transport protein ExoP